MGDRKFEFQTLFGVLETHRLIFFFFFLEPKSGFRIAFNMFDTDGNQIVDKKEFLVVSIDHTLVKQLVHMDLIFYRVFYMVFMCSVGLYCIFEYVFFLFFDGVQWCQLVGEVSAGWFSLQAVASVIYKLAQTHLSSPRYPFCVSSRLQAA